VSKETDELSDKLFQATLKQLLLRVESGEATAADMANALKFLKDNNVSGSPKLIPDMARLAVAVPFPNKG
jgi:hypothetical protein